MTDRKRSATLASLAGEARSWKERHDALLTVLNAILLAYGDGPEKRIVVTNAYVGQPRRGVATEPIGTDRFIVYLEKEDTNAPSQEVD